MCGSRRRRARPGGTGRPLRGSSSAEVRVSPSARRSGRTEAVRAAGLRIGSRGLAADDDLGAAGQHQGGGADERGTAAVVGHVAQLPRTRRSWRRRRRGHRTSARTTRRGMPLSASTPGRRSSATAATGRGTGPGPWPGVCPRSRARSRAPRGTRTQRRGPMTSMPVTSEAQDLGPATSFLALAVWCQPQQLSRPLPPASGTRPRAGWPGSGSASASFWSRVSSAHPPGPGPASGPGWTGRTCALAGALTSTSVPASVATTFMSTSARESSSYGRSNRTRPSITPTADRGHRARSGLGSASRPAASSQVNASARARRRRDGRRCGCRPVAWDESRRRMTMVLSPSAARSMQAPQGPPRSAG